MGGTENKPSERENSTPSTFVSSFPFPFPSVGRGRSLPCGGCCGCGGSSSFFFFFLNRFPIAVVVGSGSGEEEEGGGGGDVSFSCAPPSLWVSISFTATLPTLSALLAGWLLSMGHGSNAEGGVGSRFSLFPACGFFFFFLCCCVLSSSVPLGDVDGSDAWLLLLLSRGRSGMGKSVRRDAFKVVPSSFSVRLGGFSFAWGPLGERERRGPLSSASASPPLVFVLPPQRGDEGTVGVSAAFAPPRHAAGGPTSGGRASFACKRPDAMEVDSTRSSASLSRRGSEPAQDMFAISSFCSTFAISASPRGNRPSVGGGRGRASEGEGWERTASSCFSMAEGSSPSIASDGRPFGLRFRRALSLVSSLVSSTVGSPHSNATLSCPSPPSSRASLRREWRLRRWR